MKYLIWAGIILGLALFSVPSIADSLASGKTVLQVFIETSPDIGFIVLLFFTVMPLWKWLSKNVSHI